MKCLNPNSHRCHCVTCDAEHQNLQRFIYTNVDNSLAKWLGSDAWVEVPPAYVGAKVRGTCVERYLPHGAVTRIVANGAVSGEIQCQK